ncbi:hypothetical protein [Salinimicrobium soli]|uniref:hypothetical protein n=1 Tax=Salinimicrobium soli TaxID=1254399 RepID=UPI003AAE03A5
MKNFTNTLVTGILILLISGCNVYHSGTASVDEAVESDNRVRIVTSDNVFYEFKKLQRENGKIVGVAGKDSDTAKMLLNRPHTEDGRNLRFPFEEDEILAVYLKNRQMSNVVSFGVPLVGAAGLIGVTSDGFRPDVGN